jgi:hypothetical protein
MCCLLLQSIHFGHIEARKFIDRRVRTRTLPTSGYFNTCQTALDFLIHLCDHLLEQGLKLFFVLALIFFPVRIILKHVLEKIIVALLASNEKLIISENS